MEIKESTFFQLLKEFEDLIIENNNKGQVDKFLTSERNCEEIKKYVNQIIEEITRLKE